LIPKGTVKNTAQTVPDFRIAHMAMLRNPNKDSRKTILLIIVKITKNNAKRTAPTYETRRYPDENWSNV
jgi:hypothetical protein